MGKAKKKEHLRAVQRKFRGLTLMTSSQRPPSAPERGRIILSPPASGLPVSSLSSPPAALLGIVLSSPSLPSRAPPLRRRQHTVDCHDLNSHGLSLDLSTPEYPIVQSPSWHRSRSMQHSRATEQSGKRRSIGKRKLSDPQEPDGLDAPQQRTISELLSKHNNTPQGREQQPHSSPTNKRHRASSPSSSSPASARLQDLISPDRMYNFSNSEPKANGAFGQKISGVGACPATMRARANNAAPRQSNFTPHTGAKKLVVKNLRAGPRLNQDAYFEKVWAQLDAALVAIFERGKPDASLEELYKGAENVCRQGRAAMLAKKLQEKCREYISGNLRESLVARTGDESNVDSLRAVVNAWTTWNSKLVRAGYPHGT